MEDLIVSTDKGKIKGKMCKDYNGGLYYSFQGIPFAKAPLDDLRFKPPASPEPWNSIWDGTRERNCSLQRHIFTNKVIGDEDCLYLNIYTPELPRDNSIPLKPVMVYIYGGRFTGGQSGADFCGPDFLITEGVVIVTFTYRVGLLGFLRLQDRSLGITGNVAFKDMVFALQWVQRNASQFCGDPNNVTIFGDSAGGSSTHLLMLSNMGKGLFHRVIAQSSCALSLSCAARDITDELLNILECSDQAQLLKKLRRLSNEELMETQDRIKFILVPSSKPAYGYVIEDPGDGSFLTEDPLELITNGRYNQVPLLLGVVQNEGIVLEMLERLTTRSELLTNFENSIPYSFNVERGTEKSEQISKKIKTFYYGDEEVSESDLETRCTLLSDSCFTIHQYKSALYHSRTSSAPVYFYKFTLIAGLNFMKHGFKIPVRGTFHTDEVGYLFKTKRTPKIQKNSIEDLTIRRMVKLWTTFAKTGDPNDTGKNDLNMVHWRKVEPERLNFLNIGENVTAGANPYLQKMKFWDEIRTLAKL